MVPADGAGGLRTVLWGERSEPLLLVGLRVLREHALDHPQLALLKRDLALHVARERQRLQPLTLQAVQVSPQADVPLREVFARRWQESPMRR